MAEKINRKMLKHTIQTVAGVPVPGILKNCFNGVVFR